MIQGYHGGKVVAAEHGLAGHIVPSIGKQKGMKASAQRASSFSGQDLSPWEDATNLARASHLR